MKYKIALIACMWCSLFAHAQNITGIWRGYFYSGVGMFTEKYNYEVQINELSNKGLRGVTYSYRSTSFYGKALLKGIYNEETKSLIFKEDTLVEMRADLDVSPCLFTCYMDYHKQDDTETMQGTFTSVTMGNGGDCGGGTVYLERVQESDFHKEDFLLKKPAKSLTPFVKKVTPPIIKKSPLQKKDTALAATQKPAAKIVDSTITAALKLPPLPPSVTNRTTELIRTVTTNSPNIKIELYDNGEIDGDTITVYHNNALIADKKGLSKEPVTINITATAKDCFHEFVMYADNLGKIPPNTALMVITTGGKRYELFVSSTLQKNAKVIIEYQP